MNKLYHPDIKLLEEYVAGDLASGVSLLISTHLTDCEQCQREAAKLTKSSAHELFESEAQALDSNELDMAFDSLFENIEEVTPPLKDRTKTKPFVKFGDKIIPLPEKLAFAAQKELTWKEFGNDCGVAQITDGIGGGLFFIYMGPGETVPEHGHSGCEYSYVVDGYYYSEGTKLSNGDFSVFNESDIHSPATASDEGCLVISFVENRLNFFQGLLAPLNRLLWWYLKRS